MGTSVKASAAVADLLRRRREELGLSLREVQSRAGALGDAIPITVIARAERGEVDPGFRRLALLLRIYETPIRIAGDILDLEQVGDDLPPIPDPDERDPDRRRERLFDYAVVAGTLGKNRLARSVLEELLLEPLGPAMTGRVLMQAATCWHRLGAPEMALVLLDLAESKLADRDPAERRREAASVHHGRASAFAALGELGTAAEELKAALASYRDCRDVYGEGRTFGVLVYLYRAAGELEEARRAAAQGQQHALEHGHERLLILRLIDEGRVLLDAAVPGEAVSVFENAFARAVNAGDTVGRFYAHHGLWRAYSELGDDTRAQLELQNARYFVQFLDSSCEELEEIRMTLGGRGSGEGRSLRLVPSILEA